MIGIKKLKLGGSGADFYSINDGRYLLKKANNKKTNDTIIKQIKLLDTLPYSPRIIKSLTNEKTYNSSIIMPYYDNLTLHEHILNCDEKIVKKTIKKLLKYINKRKLKSKVKFGFHEYNNEKVLPLLEKGDVIPPKEMIDVLEDYEIEHFHGDLTAENILVNDNWCEKPFILLDPNPTEWKSYKLELSKFLCSPICGYEFFKKDEPPTIFANKIYDWVEKLIKMDYTTMYYIATQFLRIIPYNNQPLFRYAYNIIMFNAIKKFYGTSIGKVIYVDFDGVLYDSEKVNLTAYSNAIKKYTKKNIDELPKHLSYKDMFEKLKIPKKYWEKIHKEKQQWYKACFDNTDWNKWLVNAINRMYVGNCIVVWTKASPECVEYALEHDVVMYDSIECVNKKRVNIEKIFVDLVIEDDEKVIEQCRKLNKPYVQVKA